MQAFECHGLWNLPDTDTAPVAGTLQVSASGELRLSVIGSLGSPPDYLGFGSSKEHALVLGSVDGPLGNDVTLTGASVSRSRFGTFEGVREEYLAQRGFFGAHLNSPADCAFRRVRLRLGGLGTWTHALSGFRLGEFWAIQVGEEVPLLSYAKPASVGGPIPGGEISLAYGLTRSGGWRVHTFTERPAVDFHCDSPLSHEEINRRFIYPLQNLMTFVSDRPQEVEEVSLWRSDIETPRRDNPEIRLIGERVFPEIADEKSDSLSPHQMLFKLEDIEDGFTPFVERWLRFTTQHEDACNIFFELQYGPPAYLDFTLRCLIDCINIYYNFREDGGAHRDREDQRCKEILSKLPEPEAIWVRGHIGVRPFPPLENILIRLLDEHADAMKPITLKGSQKFIGDVVNTLNHVARRDPLDDQKSSYGGCLFRIIESLRTLLKACFLREVGFSAEKTRSFFEESGVYRNLIQINPD